MNRWMVRDEREAAVDAIADRLSYLVVSFGLLGAVAVRSFVNRETSWDLLALVVLGGFVGAGVRAQRHVVTRRWLVVLMATVAVAAVVGAITLLTTRA
jgi:hypothetical protein